MLQSRTSFQGNISDNNLDKLQKGRAVGLPGELNPAAVLTWAKVREIRRLYAEGAYRQSGLARIYGVTQAQIHLIVNNKEWIEETHQ